LKEAFLKIELKMFALDPDLPTQGVEVAKFGCGLIVERSSEQCREVWSSAGSTDKCGLP